MSVSCECCVLRGRGLCVGLITVQRSPTECDVSEYDREASTMIYFDFVIRSMVCLIVVKILT